MKGRKEYGIECFYAKEYANGAFKDFVRTLWFENESRRDDKYEELLKLNRKLRFADQIRKIERVCESRAERP